jgi:hypothetical protein
LCRLLRAGRQPDEGDDCKGAGEALFCCESH